MLRTKGIRVKLTTASNNLRSTLANSLLTQRVCLHASLFSLAQKLQEVTFKGFAVYAELICN